MHCVSSRGRALLDESHRRGPVGAFEWAVSRAWYRSRWARTPLTHVERSPVPVDVVIPLGSNDLDVVRLCVQGIRRFVAHPINRIVVVTGNVAAAADILKDRDVELIDEAVWVRQMKLPDDVRGGVLQQLLKLHARHHVATDHYLVVDADTVFLRPRIFEHRGRHILRYTDSFERAYYRTLDAFLPHVPRFPVSFVAHHMFLSRDLLDRFIHSWERNCGSSWTAVAIAADREQRCALSEYELYANQLLAERREQVLLEFWSGVNVRDVPVPDTLQHAVQLFPGKASASWHWFLRPEYLTNRSHS